MRIIFYLTLLLIFYFTYGFYIGQKDFSVIPKKIKLSHPFDFYDYRGVLNVRTDLSTGSSSPLEVISEAKKAGLDFIFLSDVNQSEKLDSFDGYHENLLVSVQGEHSFLDMRLLHFSENRALPPSDSSDQRLYFTDLLSQSAEHSKDQIVVLAHPYHHGPTWTGSFPLGLDGIEILNQKSISQRSWINNKINVLWSLVCYPFNPNLAFLRLFQEPTEELSTWDQVLKERKLFGYSGADASARAIPFASYLMKFPSYQKSFEISSNHVLLQDELNGNYPKDKQKIFQALKNGQFYIALDLLGDPKGFVAYIQDKERVYPMGSSLKFSKNQTLKVRLPAAPTEFYEIILYKNGEHESVVNYPEFSYEIKSPGVYRISVRVSAFLPLPDAKKWITWIYTNPFFVK